MEIWMGFLSHIMSHKCNHQHNCFAKAQAKLPFFKYECVYASSCYLHINMKTYWEMNQQNITITARLIVNFIVTVLLALKTPSSSLHWVDRYYKVICTLHAPITVQNFPSARTRTLVSLFPLISTVRETFQKKYTKLWISSVPPLATLSPPLPPASVDTERGLFLKARMMASRIT